VQVFTIFRQHGRTFVILSSSNGSRRREVVFAALIEYLRHAPSNIESAVYRINSINICPMCVCVCLCVCVCVCVCLCVCMCVCSSKTLLIWRHQALFVTAINRGLWWATCVDDTPRFLAKTWAATQWTPRDFYILFGPTGPRKSALVPAGLYGASCYFAVFEFHRTVLRFPSPFLFSSLAELSPRSFVQSSEILCRRISGNIICEYVKDEIK